MSKLDLLCRTALPLLLLTPQIAHAQQPASAAAPEREVAFSADQLSYNEANEIVIASGEVRMTSEGNNLRADRVVWNRRTGEVRAEGNVRVVNPGGDAAY
ncbi:MAG TPA: LPS-assembly protein LptD, partial [Allosphingosinicella sp.]|nr:LPS-assembly protein LptD [Allosphingosinicella sp.]